MPTSEVRRLPFAASWLRQSGPEGDVAISSRVRLARNLSDRAYPGSPLVSAREEANEAVLAAVRGELSPEPLGADSLDLVPEHLPAADRQFLADRSLLDEPLPSRLLATPDERLSIQIGGVDHLRIVTVRPGFAVTDALEQARVIDMALERVLNYAVAMDWGYLSSEITNIGTAMRVSTLLHSPALAMLGRLPDLGRSMEGTGYELVAFPRSDGFTDDPPGLCMLRNLRSLGSDEDALVAKLEDYTSKLVHYERAARQELTAARGEELADLANRALGVMRFARSLPAGEGRSLVSRLRLGVVAGMVTGVTLETVTELLFVNQVSHVEQRRAREGKGEDADVVRARMFREVLRTSQAGSGWED